jgi:hypothetical protein
VKARQMQSNGTYTRRKGGEGRAKLNSQEYLLRKRPGQKHHKARIKLRP